MPNKGLGVVILAAGLGKRMKQKSQKVLSNLYDKAMIDLVINSVLALNPKDVCIVVGHRANDVIRHVTNNFPHHEFKFAFQRRRLGTAHAALQAEKEINRKDIENVLVINGDTPFISIKTLKNLINHHIKCKSALTFLTARVSNPKGYGRVKMEDGYIRIIEESDLSERDSKINEINAGAYCFKNSLLWKSLKKIKKNPKKGEYYITDIVPIILKEGKVSTFATENEVEVLNINTLEDLERARDIVSRSLK